MPITIWILRDIKPLLDFCYNDILIWVALVVAVFCLLRASEFCYKSRHSVLLRRRDITWHPTFVRIFLASSKADVDGRGVSILFFKNNTSVYPFQAFRALWISSPRRLPSSPAFQHSDGSCLKYAYLLKATRRLLLHLGYSPSACGTHSCRVGGATSLALLGFSPAFIMCLGRWSSACFKRYLRFDPRTLAHASAALSAGTGRFPSPFGKHLPLEVAGFTSLGDISSVKPPPNSPQVGPLWT
jgi:hypothetical protein